MTPKTPRPDRDHKKLVGTHIDSELAAIFQLAARMNQTTGAQLIQKFVKDYADEALKDPTIKAAAERMKEQQAAKSEPGSI